MPVKFRNADELRAAGAAVPEMRREREAVFARMDYLMRAANAAARNLTADEKREYDALESILDGISDAPEMKAVDRTGVVDPRHVTADSSTYRPGVPLNEGQTFAGYAQARGLVDEDQQELSLGKYIRGMVTGDWRGAQRELKMSLAEGTSAAGGALVPTPLSAQVIDKARAQTRVLQAGARIVPMESATLKVPRVTGDPTPAWHTENASITPSDPTFDAVTLTARTLADITTMSLELVEDTSSNAEASIENVVENALAKVFALKLDYAALYGAGAPEPTGVKNQSGILTTSMGTNGANLAADDYIDAVTRLWDYNFDPTAVILSSRTGRALQKLKSTTNEYIVGELPADVAAVPRYVTTQIPTNLTQGSSSVATDLFAAEWSRMVIGVRHQISIQVLRERYADYGQVGLLVWFRGDVALEQPTAFHVVSGITN